MTVRDASGVRAAEVDAWLTRMETTAETGVDPGQTLSDYVTLIGDRWTRGIDPTSTYDPYSAGLLRGCRRSVTCRSGSSLPA